MTAFSDLWGLVQNTLNQNAGCPVLLEADLGAGVKGSNPDAKPGLETIQPGETVFIDIYSNTHGYYADTTRVFAAGQPSQKHQAVFDVLHAALQAGATRLQPGMPANQVDASVRGVPAETTSLETGMIVTLEPGIYLPGWGGMRLEGNFVIESNGARRLDTYPSELVVCE
jgi:Xaa-Pro aminopeptidase